MWARPPGEPSNHRFAKDKDINTASTPAGVLTRFREGRGEPLLLVHGLGLTWPSWKPVLGGLTAAHDVLAVDLPGFGSAPPVSDRQPTIAALADAVEAELDRAGLGRVHVAGNSLGGWVALELARRERAQSVVAFSPSGLATPVERPAQIADAPGSVAMTTRTNVCLADWGSSNLGGLRSSLRR